MERLSDLPPSEMLRVNAWSRNVLEVPDIVFRYTTAPLAKSTGESFPQPMLDTLLSKRVVVATCTTAARLYNYGVPRGHFDVIIIDESGHAWEPEAIAPVAALLGIVAGKEQQLILAGDPKQLGPIVRSAMAKEYGLGQSLLERLMDREVAVCRTRASSG